MVDYNSLFYTCSLIEFIGRERKLARKDVYASSLSDSICRLNTDLYYQSRQYLAACWRMGEIIAA